MFLFWHPLRIVSLAQERAGCGDTTPEMTGLALEEEQRSRRSKQEDIGFSEWRTPMSKLLSLAGKRASSMLPTKMMRGSR
jgi:hypothetical protein